MSAFEDEINVNGYLDELSKLFFSSFKDKFKIINKKEDFIEIQKLTKYGYKLEIKRVIYEVEDFNTFSPLKWGFKDDSIRIYDESFEEEFIVADKELMNDIVLNSYKSFSSYVDSALAKIALSGWDIIFYSDTNSIKYFWNVSDDCISPKGNCVSHIFLYPTILVATEIIE